MRSRQRSQQPSKENIRSMSIPISCKLYGGKMDHYQCIKMICSGYTALLKRFIEKEIIYEFLTGLNINFDVVKVQILGK